MARYGALSVLWAFVCSLAYIIVLYRTESKAGDWCNKGSFTVDCHHPKHLARVRSNTTYVKVIVQGAGQTGTTSAIAALRELGLRAWHADDYSVYGKQMMYDKFKVADWVRTATRCGIEAISLEPIMDMFPLVLATSPGAKVVITWRTWESWTGSLRNNAYKERRFANISKHLYRGAFLFPWVEMWDRATGHIKSDRLRAHPYYGDGITIASLLYRVVCSGYAWPANDVFNRGTRKIKAQEEAYLALIDEARRFTPKGNLLEFDARRHGWPEFARFLGVPPPPAGTPFPHPRSKHARTNEEPFENNLETGKIVWFLICMMHSGNYYVVWLFMQALALALWSPVLLLKSAEKQEKLDRKEQIGLRMTDRLAACPVIALVGASEPSKAVSESMMLVDAGVGIVEVPITSPRAAECIAALLGALPEGILVGAGSVLSKEDVDLAAQAGAVLVRSPHNGRAVIRRAKRLGLLCLSGVCTPNEAADALASGADAVVVYPAEQVSPEALAHFRPVLRPTAPLLVAWGGAPRAAASYRTAGASGFALRAEDLMKGKAGSAEAAMRRLEELLGQS